eukprot:CAMPEP_0168168846 /NCGR_PEP_ID=MMETSP0139_2-20121125/3324_1 /TAXON_ID=44445 /ORGANISM="Pseudo-nitzschia australis, Strain 10249 10 AB" /LENGTH=62 /DNA_ID=CAMNT_0008086229 /DNA_START=538 /DNA_END=722 /DNA_ORIENTATION=+
MATTNNPVAYAPHVAPVDTVYRYRLSTVPRRALTGVYLLRATDVNTVEIGANIMSAYVSKKT